MNIFLEGTHRIRTAEHTLEIITPLLNDFGITRIADVTGLDILGIPVAMAIRPLGKTLSVSQGKGVTLALAKVSAAMEAIEMWFAENKVPQPVLMDVCARDLLRDVNVEDFFPYLGSLVNDHLLLDWITGRKINSGESVFIPRAAVELDSRHGESLVCLEATSNGLASGNNYAEAVLHAIYEVVERDTLSTLTTIPAESRTYLDVASVDDHCCSEMIDQVLRAEAKLQVVKAPCRFELPCFVAYLWREDMPRTIYTGSGVHSDPAVALSRAITEAAQSRLTAIVGTRDDLPARAYSHPHDGPVSFPRQTNSIDWCQASTSRSEVFDTAEAEAEARWLVQSVTSKIGTEPIAVDLHVSEEFSVVKVFCPRLTYSARDDFDAARKVTF